MLGITDECKQLGSQSLIMLSYIKEIRDPEKSPLTIEQINKVMAQLDNISSLTSSLSQNQSNSGVIGSLVESELLSMDKAIEEAAARIQVRLSTLMQKESKIILKVICIYF